MSQLEEEVATCRTQVQQYQGELAVKEADNVSLYEKIRYLQRYSSNRQASSSEGLISVVQVDDAGVAQPKVGMADCSAHVSDVLLLCQEALFSSSFQSQNVKFRDAIPTLEI